MKKGAMILAIIGGLLGFFGGIGTVVIGGCGKAISEVGKATGDADAGRIDSEANTVAGLGLAGMIASLLAIVFGVVVGASKKAAWGSSLMLLLCGVVAFIASNYFTGPLLAIGGVLGLIGSSKSGNPEPAKVA
jgi:hypothetical protein